MLCDLKKDHIGLIKTAVEVPFEDLKSGPSPELKIEEICEIVVQNDDDSTNIRRVYVSADETDAFSEVGWVHNENVVACLSCFQEFGWFRWRHHCRTCGLLVCAECTSSGLIQGMAELGEQTVCNKCFGRVS